LYVFPIIFDWMANNLPIADLLADLDEFVVQRIDNKDFAQLPDQILAPFTGTLVGRMRDHVRGL
jgi:hypothetical protein